MIQHIITIIIVAAAFIIAGIRIYRNLMKKKEGCGGCETDNCAGCPLDELKEDIRNAENRK